MFITLAAATAPKPIDLVHASAIASSSASSILAQLSAEAAKIESEYAGEAAGVFDVYGKGQWIDDFQAQVRRTSIRNSRAEYQAQVRRTKHRSRRTSARRLASSCQPVSARSRRR